MTPIEDLLMLQSGVVSRRQALARGLVDHDLRRLVRRRELAIVHPGVMVSHTGSLTWLQRAWAAVLAAEPAPLSHRSALRAVQGPGRHDVDDQAPLHVAIDRARHLVAPSGIVVHRITHLEDRVMWSASPPRMRVEESLVDLASSARSEWDAIATLAAAVQSRITTAARIREVVDGRDRVSRRKFLCDVLDDVTAGTCSVLEHGYLVRVERAHGLPRAHRQLGESGRGPVYRDVAYRRHGLLVELDGRLFHDSPRARDRDLDRDLDAALTGRATVRLGWGQVFDRPCETAVRIGALLRARGWTGAPTTTCPACTARSVAVTG